MVQESTNSLCSRTFLADLLRPAGGSGPRPSRPGSKMNTPPLRPEPSVKAQKFIGVTKQRWSTRMCVAEVTHLRAKHQ